MPYYRFRNVCWFFAIVTFIGCRTDQLTEWDVDIAAPIAETTISLEDIFADSLIISENGQPLILRIEEYISLIPSDSILRIPDTTVINAFSLPVNFNLPSGFQIFDLIDQVRFNYGDLELTEAKLLSGTLESRIVSRVDDRLIYSLSIPEAKWGNIPFEIANQSIEAASITNPIAYETSRDLSGYTLNLRGPQLNSSNQLELNFDAQLDPNGDGAPVEANLPAIEYQYTFKNFKPYFAKGYFGTRTFYAENESVDLGILKKIEGNLDLEDATIDLDLENSVGADFSFLISQLSASKSSSGLSLNLVHPLIGQVQQIGRSTNLGLGEIPYTTVRKSFQLNSSNSNLVNVLELLPDRLNYSINARINPLGNISSGNDFIYNTANAKARMALTLPLKFAANALVFQDTIKVSGLENVSDSPVQRADLAFYFENGFPFDLSSEIRLLDANKVLLDQFFIDQEIPAASVDENLKVNAISKAQLLGSVSPENLNRIEQTRYIVVRLRINTQPESMLLPMYASYFVKVQLRAKGNLRIKI